MPDTQIAETTEITPPPRQQVLTVGDSTPLFDTGAFEHMWRIAQAMSVARMVPKHFWDAPGDCLMVVEQARRWRASPFAVAQKTYVIDGKLGYEAQLVAAIINSSPLLEGRLKHTYRGAGPDLVCVVSGRIRGEDFLREKESPRMSAIKVKNSPLWQVDPEQQLLYWTQRSWARMHAPDVILGVYTADELDEGETRIGRTLVHDAPAEPTRAAIKAKATVIEAKGVEAEEVSQDEVRQVFPVMTLDGELREFDTADDALAAALKEIESADRAGVAGFLESNAALSDAFAKAMKMTAIAEVTGAAQARVRKLKPAVKADPPAKDPETPTGSQPTRSDPAFWAKEKLEFSPNRKGGVPDWPWWRRHMGELIRGARTTEELARLQVDNDTALDRLAIADKLMFNDLMGDFQVAAHKLMAAAEKAAQGNANG